MQEERGDDEHDGGVGAGVHDDENQDEGGNAEWHEFDKSGFQSEVRFGAIQVPATAGAERFAANAGRSGGGEARESRSEGR